MVYRMPEHAVKVFRVLIGVTKQEQDEYRERVAPVFATESAILERLSNAEATASLVPKFLGADERRFALHMEELKGYRRISDVIGKEGTGVAPSNKMLKSIASELFSVIAALDFVGVAHCDISSGNVLCRLDEKGKPHLKLVDFGLSTTEEDEEKSGRDWWPAVQNVDVHAAGRLLVELAIGYDDIEAELPDSYSQDLRDMVAAITVFRRISAHFHGCGDDDEDSKEVMREDEDMWLTPRCVRRVWRQCRGRRIVFR